MFSIQDFTTGLYWSEIEFGWVNPREFEILSTAYETARETLITQGFKGCANVVPTPMLP
jgi:hypothetical protein